MLTDTVFSTLSSKVRVHIRQIENITFFCIARKWITVFGCHELTDQCRLAGAHLAEHADMICSTLRCGSGRIGGGVLCSGGYAAVA
jgi:hypothetical protein